MLYKDFIRNKSHHLSKIKIESAEGYPCRFTKTAGKILRELMIYGNSTQVTSSEIEGCGDLITDEADMNFGKYKIPVTVSGINLFAKWEVNKTINTKTGAISNISQSSGVGGLLSYPIAVQPDEYYTFAMPGSRGASSAALLAWDTKGEYCGSVTKYEIGQRFYCFKPNVITSTTGNPIATIRLFRYYNTTVGGRETSLLDAQNQVCVVNGEYTNIDNVIYEPYYEPQILPIYLDEPLYGIGTIFDTVNLNVKNRKAELIRRLNMVSSDGGENSTLSATNENITDISDSIDWNSMPKTNKDTNIITAETAIKPSNIEVKYVIK